MIAHFGPVKEVYVQFNVAEAIEYLSVYEPLVANHIDRSAVA